MKKTGIISILLTAAMLMGFSGCQNKEVSPSLQEASDTEATTVNPLTDDMCGGYLEGYDTFKVTSESLDGKYWSKTCAFQGDNLSPQLSWEPVEGATTYVIYMVDLTASNIIHWKSVGITETNLPQGWAVSAFSQGEVSKADYVGPNPPSGSTNQYNVYVFALKAPVERVKGSLGTPALKLQDFMDSLDTDAEGNTGNIVAVGRVTGYYTIKS